MKLFATNKLLKKELRKEICSVSKTFGVKRVVFNNKSKVLDGTYSADSQIIFLDNKQNKKDMLLTFFHELAHHIAVKRRKWLVYHYNPSTPCLSAVKKFNIENGIDKMAKKLWNKYVDVKAWGKYSYGYPKTQKREMVKWFAATMF